MKWEKLGRIFDPEVELKDSNLRGALMPTIVPLNDEGNLVRVYYSPRDPSNRSQIRWFIIDLNDPFQILEKSDSAALLPGELGTFDDSGTTLGSYVGDAREGLLFYTGWNLTVSVPMNNSIGVARLKPDGRFERFGKGPVMTRSLNEPFSCASPFVLKEGSKYRMWYASMDAWREEDGEAKHYYNIKHAESVDGLEWNRTGKPCIDYATESEYAFGRPFVLKENGIYKMWYAFRGNHYVIGYAESQDGLKWERRDDLAGIEVSAEGWDSEMIEYPSIHDAPGQRFMFYNGNGYGLTGIGIAFLST